MSIYGKDKDEACCDFCARDSAVYRGDGRTLFVAPNELGPVICSWCIVGLGRTVAKLLDTPTTVSCAASGEPDRMSSTEILGKDYLTREGADIAGYNQLRRLTD